LLSNVASQERKLTIIRENLARAETDKKNLEGEVAILRN